MMHTEYRVKAIAACEFCNGTKTIESLAWRFFFEETCRPDSEHVSSVDQWAKKRGFGNEAGMGPKRIDCHHCERKGTITGEVDLAQAMQDFGVLDEMGENNIKWLINRVDELDREIAKLSMGNN